MEEFLVESKSKMQKTIESFQNNLSKIRTGRANISLLDLISIDYYGTLTPLSQVAAVNVADSSTLTTPSPIGAYVVHALARRSS